MRRGNVLRRHRRPLAALIAVLVLGLLNAAGASAQASFSAHGSAEQVYVTGLSANARMSLLRSNGTTLYTQRADSLGGLLFRSVPPGSGYRVRASSGGAESGPITVHSNAAAPWDPDVYNQSIPDNGYGYLTTRDGTQLAIYVHPPTSPAGEPGLSSGLPVPPSLPGTSNLPLPHVDYAPPYPTLIEYSGYGYADPSGPENGIAVLANLMGFAVVDVNMRGTGCSGGAYDFFEPLQNLDGYDVIETIAHQPWVRDHKVGMMGISYGAISQLFTAQLDPPDLEAISPLSTIDTTATTLYPGGILNTGFAVAWAQQRQAEAEPAGPNSGQPYAYKQIQHGDQTCASNQAMHGEAASLMDKIKANSHYNPSVADALDPITFVHKINVPTFMACQWTDEQTGGHCPDLAQHFTGTKQKWFTFTNGAHIDSLDPYTYDRWYDFLELFVAHQAPIVNQAIHARCRSRHLPVGDGSQRRRNAAARPDPAPADVPVGAVGVRGPAADPRAVRQRRRPVAHGQHDARRPLPRFRAVVLEVPDTGHEGAVLVPRLGRHPERQSSHAAGHQLIHVQRQGAPADRLFREHGHGRPVGKRVGVAVELEAEPGRHCGVLSVGAAQDEHDRDRSRRRAPVAAVLDAGCRPPGHRQRGAPGRQRDVRAERLAEGERAQARHDQQQPARSAQHAARARPQHARLGCQPDAQEQVRRSRDPAVLRGSRLPRRLADQGHDRCSERDSADLGIHPDGAEGRGDRVDRVLEEQAVEPDPAGHPRSQRAHGPAAVPEPAQRAVPVLRGRANRS